MIQLPKLLRLGALLSGLVLSASLALVTLPVAARAGEPLVVFAAASLKNALDAANAAYTAKTGQPVVVSYAASSALAKQVEASAPADVFISADLAWMDELASKDLIRPESRSNLLGNALVLVAPKDKKLTIDLAGGADLAAALGDGRLAMGEVKSVPAGKYGKAALEALGQWSRLESRVAAAENVRAALALVSKGEAPLGIVYATDALSDPGVAIAGTFPESSHPPILYPAALLKSSTHPEGKAYLDYLRSEPARAIFLANGFTIPH